MRLWFVVVVYCVLVAALHVAAALSGPAPGLWGIHHYAFYPGAWLAAGLGTAVVAALLGWLRPWRRPMGHGWAAAAAVAAGGVLFWLGRERTYFMGDGFARIESLRQGTYIWLFEPLGIAFPYHLGRWLAAADPASVFAGISIGCGVLFLVLAAWLAWTVTDRGRTRLLVFGLLAAAGATRLFYGYVETYPLLAVVTLLYLVLGVRYARGRGNPFVLAASACLVFLVHTSGLLLLPSLVTLVWVRGGRARSALLVPVLVLAGGHLVLMTQGSGLPQALAAYRAFLLPLRDPSGPHFQYGLFAPGHALDLLQAQMLVGPFSLVFVAVVLLFGGFRLLGTDGRFLVLAGVSSFLLVFAFHHPIGPARQWDLFASANLIWVVLAALLLSRLPALDTRPARAGLLVGLVLGTSVFHTLAWVGMGTDEDRSLRRFAALYGPGSPAAPAARSYAFDGMGTYYLSRGEVENAEMAYKEAVTADTTNAYAAGHLGSVYLSLGRNREAAGILSWAVRYAPDREYLHYELANALQLSGNPVSALSAYRRVLELNPDFLPAYLGLASLERRTGRFAAAESLLAEADRRFPDDPRILANRAQIAHARGDTLLAVDLYGRAVLRDPDALDAVFNLGNLLYHLGRYEEAAARFETVTQRNPRDVEAWLNLASCREEQNRSTPALEALERVLLLDPERPEVYFGIFRNRMAAGDTAKAVLALGVYAGRDSTSRMGRTAARILEALKDGSSP